MGWRAGRTPGHTRRMSFVAATFIVGCGGVSTDGLHGATTSPPDGAVQGTCDAGDERCACHADGSCNRGLTCASSLCVKLPGAGGGSQSSASGGGDGSNAGAPATDHHMPGQPADAGPDTGSGSPRGDGSGGVRPGASGGSSRAGRTGAGGATGGTSTRGDGGAGGTIVVGSGGASGGSVSSGGAATGAGGGCSSGQKLCANICLPPSPIVGCGLTGCDPCPFSDPPNGYTTCLNGECGFDCLSGYTKTGNACVGSSGSGGSGGVGNCNPATCPQNCTSVYGPACCTSAGKCGCPAIPFVASTCA